MPSFDEVAQLVREQTGYSGPLTEATTLQGDLGITGDALWDLLGIWAARFAVDVSGFLWYYHAPGKTSLQLGPLRLALPSHGFKQIPITLGMLHQFAERKRWALVYPPHGLAEDGMSDLGSLCIVRFRPGERPGHP